MDYLGCTEECQTHKKSCSREACRYWINYSDDLNCSLIAVENNGSMTLEEVAKRMGISIVRVKQLQDEAMINLKNQILPILHE